MHRFFLEAIDAPQEWMLLRLGASFEEIRDNPLIFEWYFNTVAKILDYSMVLACRAQLAFAIALFFSTQLFASDLVGTQDPRVVLNAQRMYLGHLNIWSRVWAPTCKAMWALSYRRALLRLRFA